MNVRTRVAIIATTVVALGLGAVQAVGVVNWIAQTDTDRWDSIWASQVSPYSGPRLAGTGATPPAGVSVAKYARVLNETNYADGVALGNAVKSVLADPSAFVAVNEMSKTNQAKIASMASTIGTGYPNRWGVFIAYGSAGTGQFFPDFATGVDAVYAANGRLMPEFYPRYGNYYSCAGCTTDAQRDAWMNANFFNGSGKLNWLMARKTQLFPSSQSRVHPIFGIGDQLLHSTVESRNARFLDRIFYVYANQSGYRALILNASNPGGAGSYLWAAGTIWGPQTATARDSTFAVLWKRYGVDGLTTPNWTGAMPAP